MRVAAVQFEPKFGQIKENIKAASELIKSTEANLYVLPELCFSGYTFISRDEAFSLSENAANGYSIAEISELSAKLKAAIVFGFPENSNGKLYNSCILVTPNGQNYVYRKLHLFMHEKLWFSPGDLPMQLYDYDGAKLGMMICFDWIFPEVARSLALSGAQILCHPANLVMPFCQYAMITRSIENRVFSITANRIGRETRGEFDFSFTGKSQVVSNKGELLISASNNKVEVIIADIENGTSDDKWLNKFNNLWGDRRPDFYSKVTDGEEKS